MSSNHAWVRFFAVQVFLFEMGLLENFSKPLITVFVITSSCAFALTAGFLGQLQFFAGVLELFSMSTVPYLPKLGSPLEIESKGF